jgi:hypothetical protein
MHQLLVNENEDFFYKGMKNKTSFKSTFKKIIN